MACFYCDKLFMILNMSLFLIFINKTLSCGFSLLKIYYRTCCSFFFMFSIVSSIISIPAHFLTLFATLFLLFSLYVFPILFIAFSLYFSFNSIPIYSLPKYKVYPLFSPLCGSHLRRTFYNRFLCLNIIEYNNSIFSDNFFISCIFYPIN